MPLLDVSDILDDPDLFEWGLKCVRQTQTIDNDGIAHNTPTYLRFVGVVTNLEGKKLDRKPDAEHVSGSILIITRFRLIDGRTGQSADVVQRDDLQYTVMQVEPYIKYGRGFVQAECDLINLSG